jgi:hypothetical protein
MPKSKKLAVSKANPTKVQTNNFKKRKTPKKALNTQGFVQSPKPLAISKIPYFELANPVEKTTMKIMYIQFKIKQLVLLPLHRFLCAKGLASPTDVDIDLQDILWLINKKNTADPVGFLNHPLASDEVDKAISVRNNTDHIDLTGTNQTWQTQLPAYVLLCQSINESAVAAEIQDIINQMVSGCLDNIVRFSFAFTAGYTLEKAFALSQIVYGVLLEFLAKEIWTFLKAKLGITNITLDLYANLKYINDQMILNPDFFGPGGGSRGDACTVQTAYDTRMDNAHGGYTRSSTAWQPQMESAVQILKLINKHEVALKVQIIIDRLVRLATEQATVTNDEFKFME